MPGFDPFGSLQNMIGQFRGFMQNPMQFMMRNRLNLPQGMNPVQNPQATIQHLLNNGQMTQAQYNQLQQAAKQIQANPQFMQMLQQMQGGR